MSEWKVTASHRSRAAVIYVRQSTMVQVERNRESTARQYDLVSRARELGWPRTAVTVIDEDLGVSGASAAGRSRVRAAGRPGRHGPGRDRAVAGGLPAGPQQRRLVPAAGAGRDDRHPDRRRRRRLSSGAVRRQAASWG